MVVLAIINHFRRHILQCTAKSISLTFIHLAIVRILRKIALTRPPKVAYFQHVVLIHQQILRLQIPVDKAIFVQKVDTCARLNEKVKSRFLRKTALFLYQDKKVTLCNILHYQVNVLAILKIRIHSHNIHMFKFFMDLDLASECFFHFGCGDFSLVKLLNGYLDSRWPVEGQLDRAVGTFAELPVFKFKLIESHISQHLLILAICLTGYSQLSLLNERR